MVIVRPEETPPRAWGRHSRGFDDARLEGNTPTGVGKTDEYESFADADEKHPHGRGEDMVERLFYLPA